MKAYEIIKQHDLKDCGACALLSIIRHYGGDMPLEKVRMDTHTSLEGTNAYHLIEAAKNYGFDAYGMKLDSLDNEKNFVLPAIAHIEKNHILHFVVIYKISTKRIEIMDPAEGKIKMDLKTFHHIWTKHILLFYPKYSLPTIKNQNFLKTFFGQMLKKEKKSIIRIILLTILFTFVTIFYSFYFKIEANIVTENNILNVLISIAIPFFFLFVIKTAIYYLKNYFKLVLNKNIDGYLYDGFLKRLFLLPNYFIKNRTTGELSHRLTELSNFKTFFNEMMTTLLIDSIFSIGIGMILLKINNRLFSILCFFAILYLIYGIISGKILYGEAKVVNEKEIDFQAQAVENLDTMIALKNVNVLQKATQKLEVKLFKFLKKTFHFQHSILKMNTIMVFFEELLHFLIITIGLFEIAKGKFGLMNLITFEELLNYFLEPFKHITQLIPEYNCIKVSLEKMSDFYSLELEDRTKGLKLFQPGDIVITNLTFSYLPLKPIIENLSITIKENSFVLIKGKSGCGKSTLCQIISRRIENNTCNIKIGNLNIYDYSLETIQKNITYVGQKETLIQETIRNNILFYREIEEEEFKKVIQICKIDEIVEKKPLRFETFLMKESINLSGGEKQRIILARALLNKSKILVLDEALSEVNKEMELEIIKQIQENYKEKTIIYVSHKDYDQHFDKVIDFEKENERRNQIQFN